MRFRAFVSFSNYSFAQTRINFEKSHEDTRAIDAMRMTTPAAKDMPIYVHDGFDLEGFSSFVANRTDFVVQDHHSYFVFSASDKKESGTQHTADVQSSVSQALAAVSEKQHRNLVVDEWSCALTPESVASEGNVDQVRKDFCAEQMKVYSNATAGWSFWGTLFAFLSLDFFPYLFLCC
jgi:glucan 1,3-beta-glucosidase